MPNRIIKESICTSANMDRLKPDEEILFYRLMVNCDDYGRMDARPAIIRAKCFPLKVDKVKETDVAKWISALEREDLIVRYQNRENIYLQMVTWPKHQQIRAKISKFPAIDDNDSTMISDDIKCNHVISDAPVIVFENRNRESIYENREASPISCAEFVKLTPEEYQKLIDDHGEVATNAMIEILDNYKGANGKKYKSDYRAIKNWVVKRYQEEQQKQKAPALKSPARPPAGNLTTKTINTKGLYEI